MLITVSGMKIELRPQECFSFLLIFYFNTQWFFPVFRSFFCRWNSWRHCFKEKINHDSLGLLRYPTQFQYQVFIDYRSLVHLLLKFHVNPMTPLRKKLVRDLLGYRQRVKWQEVKMIVLDRLTYVWEVYENLDPCPAHLLLLIAAIWNDTLFSHFEHVLGR